MKPDTIRGEISSISAAGPVAGPLLILIEIISSQTLFSKLGNIVSPLGPLGYARQVVAQH